MKNMDTASLVEIIREKADSDENKARKTRARRIHVGLEEPIASAILFGYDVNGYFGDPEFYLRQTLIQKLWRFEHIDDDCAIDLNVPLWLGHYPEYSFFGMEASYTASGIPHMQTNSEMLSAQDISPLSPVDFHETGLMPKAHRMYGRLLELAGGQIGISFLNWWRGPLDLAVQLRGYDGFIADTAENPAFVHELMGFLTAERIRWHEAYRKHFQIPEIYPTGIGDDWINAPFITPSIFEEYVLPYYLKIEEVHGGIGGIHSCGNQAPFQKLMLKIRSLQGFEVSAWTSLEDTLENIPPDKYLSISVHPNDVLFADRKQTENRIGKIAKLCKGRGFSLSTSGLTPVRMSEKEFVDIIKMWLDCARENLN